MANEIAIVKHESKKTNPNVKVFAVDENYLKVSGQTIAEGRNFSKTEIESGSDVIIVGRGIYGSDKDIVVEAQRYRDAGWNAYLERLMD